MDKVTGTTKTGFPFEIDKDVFDDWDTMDIVRRIHGGDSFAIFDLIPRILGQDQTEKLKEHVREESGRVPVSKMNEEVMDIMAAFNKGNSSSSPG